MLGHSIRHVSIYVGLGLNHLGLILLLYQCPLRERNNRALGCHTCLLSYLLKETLLPPFSSRITTKYAIWHLQSTGLSNTKSEVYGFEAPSTPLHSPQREKTHSLHTWFFLSHWEMEMLFRGYKGLYPLTCNMEEKEILVLHMQKKSSWHEDSQIAHHNHHVV